MARKCGDESVHTRTTQRIECAMCERQRQLTRCCWWWPVRPTSRSFSPSSVDSVCSPERRCSSACNHDTARDGSAPRRPSQACAVGKERRALSADRTVPTSARAPQRGLREEMRDPPSVVRSVQTQRGRTTRMIPQKCPGQEVSQAVPARVVHEPDERGQQGRGTPKLRHLLGADPHALRQLKAAQLRRARLQTVQRVVHTHLAASNEVQ